MGQYHFVINLDKKEYINPHEFGMGLKQWEHLGCECSIGDIAMFLMMYSEHRGGGDLPDDENSKEILKGRWHGDHVVYIGDYAKEKDHPILNMREIYDDFRDNDDTEYKDVSPLIRDRIGELFEVKFINKNGMWEKS